MVELPQRERLKDVHLHIDNLNLLIRKTGHTFQVSEAAPFAQFCNGPGKD